jgi:hypothetical protein
MDRPPPVKPSATKSECGSRAERTMCRARAANLDDTGGARDKVRHPDGGTAAAAPGSAGKVQLRLSAAVPPPDRDGPSGLPNASGKKKLTKR